MEVVIAVSLCLAAVAKLAERRYRKAGQHGS